MVDLVPLVSLKVPQEIFNHLPRFQCLVINLFLTTGLTGNREKHFILWGGFSGFFGRASGIG
jgi:hypothetical protein